jgi:hypothetical protein
MDIDRYTLEFIVRGRLAELHADADRRNRFEAGGAAPRRLRDTLGCAFIRLGTRLLGARKTRCLRLGHDRGAVFAGPQPDRNRTSGG